MTVLAAATGLLDQFAVAMGRGSNGFAVGNLGLADIGFHLEFTHQAVNNDFQVKFTHAGNQGFFISLHPESRVFFRQTAQGIGHFFLVSLGLGLYRHGNNGFREGGGFQADIIVRASDGVARGHVAQPNDGGNVTGVHGINIRMLVSLNLNDAAHAFRLAGAGIVHGVTFLENTGVHADEHQLADEFVSPELERQHHGLGIVRSGDFEGLFRIQRAFRVGGNGFYRRGEVIHHGVKQELDAFVLESGATGDRHKFVGDGGAADSFLELFGREGFFHEHLFSKLIVHVSHTAHEFMVGQFGFFLEFGGNIFNRVGGAQAIVVGVNDGFLVHHVNLAAELVFSADGDQNGSGIRAQLVVNIVQHVVEVGAGTVHLVDEAHAGHAVLGGLTPHGFRLGLHSCHAAEHHDGAVKHAEGTFHFSSEVNVPGSINNVQLEIFAFEHFADTFILHLLPVGGNSSGGNGDTAFAFLLHPVGRGGTVVGFTNLVNHAGVEKDTLGQRGFAGVNVSGNTDIAVTLKGSLAIGIIYVIGHSVWKVSVVIESE